MTSPIERPDCAGWHEADPICDGDPATHEPACSFKPQCLKVVDLAGGPKARTNTSVTKVLAAYTDGELTALLDETSKAASKATDEGEGSKPPTESVEAASEPDTGADGDDTAVHRAEAPTYPPINDTDGGKLVMTARTIYPRPSPRYDHVLPVVDGFVERFAREVGRTLRIEGDPATKPGDLFVRWTLGMQGRAANLYAATDRGTRRHRLLTRIVMLVRDPRFNLKTNIPDSQYTAALAFKPPVGPDCRVWVDVKPHVALVGVDAHAARDAARWLARCYDGDLVDDIKRRKPRKGPAKPKSALRMVGS